MDDKINIRVMLIASIQRALLGMIYPSIRGIAVGYEGLQKLIVIYYLDRPPTEDDYENLSEVTSEVLADIQFEDVEEICKYSEESLSGLNQLDFWAYMRKE